MRDPLVAAIVAALLTFAVMTILNGCEVEVCRGGGCTPDPMEVEP